MHQCLLILFTALFIFKELNSSTLCLSIDVMGVIHMPQPLRKFLNVKGQEQVQKNMIGRFGYVLFLYTEKIK